MVTIRYIRAPMAVVARICIGVDCILACPAIVNFTLLIENRTQLLYKCYSLLPTITTTTLVKFIKRSFTSRFPGKRLKFCS
jgi:hypothetical protein